LGSLDSSAGRFSVSVTVAVASGTAVGVGSPPNAKSIPTNKLITAVMITVGQPNRFGFFGCC